MIRKIFSLYKNYGDLVKLILMAEHRIKDYDSTLVLNAVIQSGMSFFLHCVKDCFSKIVIVGHPTTLRYCYKVLGRKAYRRKIVWVKSLNYDKMKKSAIIADDSSKNCDLFVDLDFYNEKKRSDSLVFPYYQPPAYFYFGHEHKCENYRPVKCRIFGGGAIPLNGYPILAKSFPQMLNRTEIVDFVQEKYGSFIESPMSAEKTKCCDILFAYKDARKGIKDYLLSSGEFLLQLGNSDFFIAPPGNGMPHCHNVMECMSLGTIPITNYSEWFEPKLQDGVNCLSFSTREELCTKIEFALNMPESEIQGMKANVREYYQKYCKKDSVLNLLRSNFHNRKRIRLLVNDEGTSIEFRIKNVMGDVDE